ncbi:hypothetical protein D3C72_1942870 [compost metagenome]
MGETPRQALAIGLRQAEPRLADIPRDHVTGGLPIRRQVGEARRGGHLGEPRLWAEALAGSDQRVDGDDPQLLAAAQEFREEDFPDEPRPPGHEDVAIGAG